MCLTTVQAGYWHHACVCSSVKNSIVIEEPLLAQHAWVRHSEKVDEASLGTPHAACRNFIAGICNYDNT